jgi:hypothetical protein
MMRTMWMLALLPLAACNKGPAVSAENASVAEVAKKVADAGGNDSFVRPGKWESHVRMAEFSMPGAPPEVATTMRNMQKDMVSTSCLTPDQAKKPSEDFFTGTDKNCRYDHFNIGGGKIDGEMNCSAQGTAQKMVMHGTYRPDAYQMEMSMKTDAGVGPPGGMTMKMRVDAKRVGECDGKTA